VYIAKAGRWNELDTINLNRELMAKMKERVDKPRDPHSGRNTQSGKSGWPDREKKTEQSRGACSAYKSTERDTLPIDPQLVAIVSYSHLLFLLLKGISADE
jgi:hypothetical protein